MLAYTVLNDLKPSLPYYVVHFYISIKQMLFMIL